MSLERLYLARRSYSDNDWVLIGKGLNAIDRSAQPTKGGEGDDDDEDDEERQGLGWSVEKMAEARRLYILRSKKAIAAEA